MNLARTLVISWDVLMGHRLRTVLSSAGIAIGVAAVVIMVGAGKAAEEEVVGKVRSMGTNLLVVQAGRFQNLGGRTRQVATFTTLTQRDVQALSRRLTGIERIAGVYQRSAVVRYKGIRTRTDVAGAEPALFKIRGISDASGRLFTDLEQRSLARVAVVGPTVVTNVFSGADPVGRSVEINKILFKVVGVASPRGQDLSGDDQDDVVYVPLSTAMVRVFHVTYLQSILIQAESAEAMATLPD
ncbi:MAG: ABC transporter permease, partial [Acidobacteriota bacterium]